MSELMCIDLNNNKRKIDNPMVNDHISKYIKYINIQTPLLLKRKLKDQSIDSVKRFNLDILGFHNTSLKIFKNLGAIDENPRVLIMQYCQFHEIYLCRRLNRYYNQHFNEIKLYKPDLFKSWNELPKTFQKKTFDNIPTLCRVFIMASYAPILFSNLKIIDFRKFTLKEYTAIAQFSLYLPITLDLLQLDIDCNGRKLFRCKQIKRIEIINDAGSFLNNLTNVYDNNVIELTSSSRCSFMFGLLNPWG